MRQASGCGRQRCGLLFNSSLAQVQPRYIPTALLPTKLQSMYRRRCIGFSAFLDKFLAFKAVCAAGQQTTHCTTVWTDTAKRNSIPTVPLGSTVPLEISFGHIPLVICATTPSQKNIPARTMPNVTGSLCCKTSGMAC